MENSNFKIVEVNYNCIPMVPVPRGQKHPNIKWKELRNQEPSSYREDFTNKNCALLTGNTLHCNFIAFDFDCYEGLDAVESAKFELEAKYGSLPWEEAYIQTTPSGGIHYVFRLPLGVAIKNATDLLNNRELPVDIRADGGLLVLAPSVAKNKKTGQMEPYKHINNIALENAAFLDSAVYEKLITPEKEAPAAPTATTATNVKKDTSMTTGMATFFNEAISRCASNLAMASEGSRNEELNRQAFKMGTFVGAGFVQYQDAHSMLASAAYMIGLEATEINATLSSGLQAGLQNPVALPTNQDLNTEWIEEHQISSIWATPKPLEAPVSPVMQLSANMLPEDIYKYATYKAYKLDNAPVEFVAIPLIISYAATLGTSHVIKPKASDYDWKETPVLWGGLIAPPSTKKTPCLSVGTKPVKKAQAILTEKFKQAEKSTKVKTKIADKKAKALEEEAMLACEQGDEETANQKFLEAEELRSNIIKPVERKVVINDATIEAIGVRLGGTKDGILIQRDELSGLLTEFKDERSPIRAFYLEGFNGSGDYSIERISRDPVYISRLALWLCGGIQPDRLMHFLHARKHGGDNDGLLERMQLLVMPDIPEGKYVDKPLHDDEKDLVGRVNAAFERAATIGFDEKGRSHVLSFDVFAQQLWAKWMEEHHQKITKIDTDMQPVVGKHVGLCARLALVFHMFEGNASNSKIELPTLEKAIRFVEFLETHQYRIFGSCEKTMLHDLCKQFIEKQDGLPNPFTLSDIGDKNWAAFGKDNRDIVLDKLCELGYLLRMQSKNKRGRPTIQYFKHPDYCSA